MHQRLMNSSAKAGIRTGCSVPATGCAGTKWTPAARCGAMSRTTAPLTEPTSETIAPAARKGAISCGDRAAGADGNAEDDEVGVLHRFLVGLHHAIDDAEFGDRARDFSRARGGDDLAGQSLQPCAARDRAADQAEADQRDTFEYGRGVHLTAHLPAMKSRRPSTTRRLASSVPMVMRSVCGRP